MQLREYSILELKSIAKTMSENSDLSHSQALNYLAKNYGYKSWTSLLANTTVEFHPPTLEKIHDTST